MEYTELFKPRYGLTHDPNWDHYHQWDWGYFPITFPACTITRRQRAIDRRELAIITWEVEKGVPIVCRFDDSTGRIMSEMLPEKLEWIGDVIPSAEYVCRSGPLDIDQISGSNGIAFEWVFEIPIKPAGTLQPWHRLGVVRVEGSELAGKETIITVSAGGREKDRIEFLSAQQVRQRETVASQP